MPPLILSALPPKKEKTRILAVGGSAPMISSMSGRNSRGIHYAEWYTDDGDGALSQRERELPHEYTGCISRIAIGALCRLPNDISFSVLDAVGEGTSGQIWRVKIWSDTGGAEQGEYALKLSQKWNRCGANQLEYRLLYLLHEEHLNMPWLHPNIPYYWFGTSCMLFLHLIDHSFLLWNLYELYHRPNRFKADHPEWTARAYIASFEAVDGGLLDFVLQCYRDIMAVTESIYSSVGLVYNDLHPGNILVDADSHRCHLIDFGSVFSRQLTFGRQRGRNLFEHEHKFKCERSSCSPLVHFNVQRQIDRHSFRWRHSNQSEMESADMLMQYAMDRLSTPRRPRSCPNT